MSVSDLTPSKISIVEKEIVKISNVSYITVEVGNITLFKNVFVNVNYYSKDDTYIECHVVEISGDDYLQWTQDDKTLIDIVARKLDLTLK
jgi:hypothetical protein